MKSLMVVLGGGKPMKGEMPKGEMSKPKAEGSGEYDEGTGADEDDGIVIAGDVLRALKSSDPRALAYALQDFHMWCDMMYEQECEGEKE